MSKLVVEIRRFKETEIAESLMILVASRIALDSKIRSYYQKLIHDATIFAHQLRCFRNDEIGFNEERKYTPNEVLLIIRCLAEALCYPDELASMCITSTTINRLKEFYLHAHTQQCKEENDDPFADENCAVSSSYKPERYRSPKQRLLELERKRVRSFQI